MKQTTLRKQSNGGHDHKIMPFALLTRGAAAASVAGLVFAASPAHEALGAAPDFLPKVRQGNPLMIPVGVNLWAKPTLVDIDADGDMDIFVGDGEGAIAYFENIGTDTAPNFALATGSNNPFWYYESGCDTYYPYSVGEGAAPTFVDIDADGDMDAFVGQAGGYVYFFKNTGTETAPAFTRYYPSDSGNPFNFYVGQYATLAFADLDGDGDMDALGGEGSGRLHYFENTGTASAPEFEHYYPYETQNPFYQIDVGDDSAPALVDIDGDGDMDAFVGERDGNINFFENVGTPYAPVFELKEVVDGPVTKYLVPSSNLNVKYMSAPAFADIDGDGDMDAVVGDYVGQVTVFENTGDATDPAFTQMPGTASPTFGFDVKYYSAPAFVDIDGDGDMDAFIGNDDGELFFAENSGTATAPLFATLADYGDTANPFMGVDVGGYSAPTFVDIDGDGDMDAVVGEHYYNIINFFENMGTASAPAFIQRFDADNPVGGVFFGDTDSAPAFVDIDNDGDMDLFVGTGYGDIAYFENTGSASAPAFATSGIMNPFGLTDPGIDYSAPAFADIDGDGDMDVVIGNDYGELRYFENTGTETAPAFTELTGTNNPFDGTDEWIRNTMPTFVDIDGDGDMDLFTGEYYGRVVYFENRLITTPPPADDDDDDDDGVIIPLADDDSNCFIDSVSPEAGQENWLAAMARNIYATVRSLLRY